MATAPNAPAPLAITTSTNTLHNFQTSQNSASPGHKRTYQACIPCRKRKVRCELGPVDAPQDPPCARCRRESKDCHFSATRRKRKAEDDESDLGEDEHTGDEFAARNERKRSTRTSGSLGGYEPGLQDPRRSMTSGSLSAISQLDGYSLPPQGPLQPPDPYSTGNMITKSEDGQDHEVTNETAADLFRTPINIPGDALHLLLKASNQSEDLQRRDLASQGRRPISHPLHDSSPAQGSHRSRQSPTIQRQGVQVYSTNIDPAIGSRNIEHRETSLSAENVKLWSRLRFVHAGWFTVSEAISYIDYFYEHLNPLTPISLPAYRPDTAHSALLKEEPMLTVTILTIASRYKKLVGPGAQTRAFKIHEKLWEYLRDMITRMFWGQEQFGGGFCGAGKRRVAPNGALGGLRSLGTIESLLLLSEFHPKSMHFPPRDDDGEILIFAEDEWTDADLDTMNGRNVMLSGWSEPVARSDQMCRSLIGMAYVLAYELGIFGDYANGIVPVEERVQTHNSTANQRLREERVERALYIFTTQASGRFGLPSIYSDQVNRFSLNDFIRGSHSIDSTMLPESVDRSQQCWVDLMSIMKETNRVLFPSKDHTALIIQNGGYMSHLDRIQPMLVKWYRMFEKLDVPKYPRLIISIEYHYISLYINSLALQAVIEQWANKVSSMPQIDSPASPASSISSSYVNIYSKNERYIKEVIYSARTVLKHVVEGFLPDDYLKHAPVRTIFRILTSAMFLLKTFAIGGKADEVSISRRLLADTAKALRTSYVDDVHVCLRVADLLEGLIEKVGKKFVRLPPRTQEPPAQYNSNNTYNQQAQFQYHPNPGDTIQDPLDGLPTTYDSPHNRDITIMPPLGNGYFGSNNPNYNFQSPSSYNGPQQQQNQEAYAMNNDGADPKDFSMGTDWLALDLNGLVDQSGVNGNGGYEWFGAFGPEAQNNLEVLGKLSNGRYPGLDEYGDGGGMNF